MQIIFNDKQKLISESARAAAESKLAAAFTKFGYHVRSAEFNVADANGPRGGVDKECRLVIKLRKMDEVVVTVKEESLSKAISRSIGRAERGVARKVQKRAIYDLGNRARLGFAIYE